MTDTRTTDDLHPAEAAWLAAYRAGTITWAHAAEQAMKQLADSGRPFSADDLRELLDGGEQPTNPNVFGGLFMSWSRQGLIERAGEGPSTMPRRNGGHRYLWRGVRPATEEGNPADD